MRPWLVLTLIACALAAALAAACNAGVVTVDIAARTTRSDDDKLGAKWLMPRGEQVGVLVQNVTLAPRDLVIKFPGLKDQSYDVYVNAQYSGAKDSSALASGLQLTVNGTVADPAMMRCLRAAQPNVDAEFRRLAQFSGEPKRVNETLRQAADWIRLAIKAEQTFRSVAVIVLPAGQTLQKVATPTWMNDRETAAAITRACFDLQKARATMSRVINDPDLRSSAVGALTPVDFTASSSVRGGKPHIDAVITNDCNLPITGKITAAVPKGWKWTAKSTAFKDLMSGRTFKLSFDLVPTAKGAAIPEGVKMAAEIKLAQAGREAGYQIKTIARP